MNVYFLVEGRSTESKIYPKFIDYFFEGDLNRVKKYSDMKQDKNNYYLISGEGYPQIYTHILPATIQDINSVGNFDYLIVALDADDLSEAERIEEFNSYINSYKDRGIILNPNCRLELIVQNRCFETWFLGNKTIYKENPQDSLYREFQNFYNVKISDPEQMGIYKGFETHASFHLSYLKHFLKERNIHYSKKNPREVGEGYYIKASIERCKDNHLQSFMRFVKLCIEIKKLSK